MTLDRRLWIVICAAALLSGCGYIAEPLPPLMNIPARAADVTAVQRGGRLIVQFQMPAMTTEGTILKAAAEPDLRIGPAPNGPFQDAGAGPIENGRVRYELPAADWIGKTVAIQVRIVGANKRDAGWSNPLELTVVPPPERPTDLQALSDPLGVRLEWKAAGDGFAISRMGPGETAFAPAAHSDKPEWIDTTAEFGKTYRYIVQSLVKAGKGEAQSDLSDPVQVAPKDTFPPSAPAGLTAVPSTASIELVWERNTDPKVTGYRVYRADGTGPFSPLGDPQPLPSYSDRQLQSGKTYRYAVAAVKANGLESPMSAPVEATAP
ncbi:MAG: hypothetical protein U0Q18_11330 [Bryobacteraceae bacterium]